LKINIVGRVLQKLKQPLWLCTENGQNHLVFVKRITDIFCFYVPQPLRKYLLTVIDNFAITLTRIFTLFSQLKLTCYLISGKEKTSNLEIKILFFGENNNFSYILDQLFSEEPKIKILGKESLRSIVNIYKKNKNYADAFFIKCDRFYQRFLEKKGCKIIPEYVSLKVDVSKQFTDIYKKFNKSAKEDIRKVKKGRYSYEITDDLKKIKFFYERMYIPYSYKRYGNLAICSTFSAIRHLVERGSKLMLIKKNDDYVFGCLFFFSNNTIIGTHAGIIDGQEELLKEGVSSASYYFAIIYSKKLNFKYLDFGTCRPFLNNGLFRYKKKWGASVEHAESIFSVFGFNTIYKKGGLKEFLLHNPFISNHKNNLEGNIFLSEDLKSNTEEVQNK
jgi:hypothetical protein